MVVLGKATGNGAVKPFVPSHYQLDIFDFIQNGEGNGVISARAGTGKTKTLLESFKFVKEGKKVAFVAFNKHIQIEIEKKAPKNIDVCTLHSLGRRILYNNGYRFTVDGYKLKNIAESYFTMDLGYSKGRFYDLYSTMKEIINKCKSVYLEPTPENIKLIMETYPMTIPYAIGGPLGKKRASEIRPMTMEEFNKHVAILFYKSLEDISVIDFNDMVYLPLHLNLHIGYYDMLFVDECQDLNNAQSELALRSIKKNGRIIAVGDINQSIYGFAGANVDSVDNLIRRLNATVLPLNICYRCPKSHIALAQKIVPEIEAADDAIEGEVHQIGSHQIVDLAKKGDMIICRTNSHLIKLCFAFMGRGIKVNVKGRDFGKTIINLIEGTKSENTLNMLNAVDKWYAGKVEEAENYGTNSTVYADQRNCIFALCDLLNAKKSSDVVNFIKDLYTVKDDDNEDEVVNKGEYILSTVHGAKGLEADNVFVLGDELMPLMRKDMKKWEYQQEMNIRYVALTRAKKALYLSNITEA